MIQSLQVNRIDARDFKEIHNFDCNKLQATKSLGLDFDEMIHDERSARDFMDFQRELGRKGHRKIKSAMDSIQPTITTGSIPVAIQFLQAFVPGHVLISTNARKIKELIGMRLVGKWSDEYIVMRLGELTGYAGIYGDTTNTQLANWNNNYVHRTIVRGEIGFRVGKLETERAAAEQYDPAALKRLGCQRQAGIFLNGIGFNGFNNGTNETYGFLNDPQLPAYVALPGNWIVATFYDIQADLINMYSSLRNNSGDLIDPASVNVTLAVATSVYDKLSKTATNGSGQSVFQWLKETYPKTRVVSAPELNAANGGQNVVYLYAEELKDESTDGGQTWDNDIQSEFMSLGVAKEIKYYAEGFTFSANGAVAKRPFLIVRRTGA